jgi:hypothetical protein
MASAARAELTKCICTTCEPPTLENEKCWESVKASSGIQNKNHAVVRNWNLKLKRCQSTVPVAFFPRKFKPSLRIGQAVIQLQLRTGSEQSLLHALVLSFRYTTERKSHR